jgi:hypothetical protein
MSTEDAPSPDTVAESSESLPASTLPAASPFWLHRVYLGLTGIAIAQWLALAQTALFIIIYFAQRAHLDDEMRLVHFLPSVNYLSFALLWFSAIYLVAAPETRTAAAREPMVSPRKLVIYLGCATALLTFFPSAIYPVRSMLWMSLALAGIGIAAILAFLVYLLKLAERAGDAYLKKHIPIALAVTLVSNAFSIAQQLEFAKADDLRIVLNIGAIVYLLHIVTRLRRLFADALGGVAKDSIAF